MRKSSLSFLLALWVIIPMGFFPEALAKKPAPVVLGAIYNLFGSQADLDRPSSQGALLAVKEINAKGGLLGSPVLLLLRDGESKTALVAKKTSELLQHHPSLTALMGLSDTDMVLAAAPIAAKNKRLFLTSGATSPKLPAQVPEYLFLACFGDNVQAAAGAQWAYQIIGARTVSVLYNSSKSYTRLLQGYFQESFKQLGGKVLSVKGYQVEAIDPGIEGLKKADLIYLSAESPEEALKAVSLLRKAGFSVPILGGDGFDSAEVWKSHPEINKVYFTTHAYVGPDNPDPKVVAFRKAYQKTYPGNIPDAFAALGYDTAQLLMAAVAHAQSPDPAKVLQALSLFRKFDGVTGTLSYAPGSRIPTKTVTILGINQGKIKLVKQLMPSKVPPP